MKAIIDNIKSINLDSEEFGLKAHLKMSHTGRRFYPDSESAVKQAAVIHLIYPKNDVFHFSLIRRSARNPNDKHGGQVGLAGGAQEAADLDISDTAIRELHEEIGVQLTKNEIVRKLSTLYIPVSGFNVHPFLAIVANEPRFTLQEAEVDYLIEVPLEELFKEANKAVSNMEINQKFALKNVPHYKFFDHIVWGATAMMLSELEELFIASNYPFRSN